jgi:hypothetical protein
VASSQQPTQLLMRKTQRRKPRRCLSPLLTPPMHDRPMVGRSATPATAGMHRCCCLEARRAAVFGLVRPYSLAQIDTCTLLLMPGSKAGREGSQEGQGRYKGGSRSTAGAAGARHQLQEGQGQGRSRGQESAHPFLDCVFHQTLLIQVFAQPLWVTGSFSLVPLLLA